MVELKKFFSLIMRNTKCYFKDKVSFFMSLITPLILLFLFMTFLRNVYIEIFESAFPEGFSVDKKIVNGIAGAWLMSSILGVSSVTVAFCSNLVMVDDKIQSCINDFKVSPVKPTTISFAYFASNFFVTFIVMMCAMLIGHIYLGAVGWYITAGDAFLIVVDCICCILFGSLLAGIVESFISSQGAMSAVATLVSSMYGFICGAYMPISSFSTGLQNVLALLPGTYSVGIIRTHYMSGYLEAMLDSGLPEQSVTSIKEAFDMNISAFGNNVSLGAMYGIVLGSCALLLIAYVTIIIIRNKLKK